MKRASWFGLVVALIAGGASTAAAETKKHDGFYMQLTSGVGYYSVTADGPGGEESLSGMTLGYGSLIMGGTIMPGLIVGGGLFIDSAPTVTYEANGQSMEMANVSQYVLGIGPFVDYYLDPKGGLHFMGHVGWGGVETSNNGNAGGSDPTGIVMSIGAGYDFFVSDELSIGLMGRFAYGLFSFNETDMPTIAPAILGTVTWQ